MHVRLHGEVHDVQAVREGYDVVLKGASTLNGIGVYGKATFKGVGYLPAQRRRGALLWDGTVDLGKPNGRR